MPRLLKLLSREINNPEVSNFFMFSNRNLIRLVTRAVFVVVQCSIFHLNAQAQSEISGLIKNEYEIPINKVTVILINAYDSAEVMSTISHDNGAFVFANLPVGDYMIKVCTIGFESKLTSRYSIISSQDVVDVGVLMLRFMKTLRLGVLPPRPLG